MKKILGVGFIFLVAVGSFLLPSWLTFTELQQANSLPVVATSHFLPVASTLSDSTKGQPVLAAQTGRVWEVYFHDGQRVQKGQLLVKLVVKQPSVLQQQLQARLQRQQQAYDALIASQVPKSAPAALAAQEQLMATRQQLARAVPMLSHVYVTAPANGIITGRRVATGDQLTPTTEVARLSSALLEDTTLLLSSVE